MQIVRQIVGWSGAIILVSGCVGGGSSQTPPSYAVDPKTEQLYSELAATPNQLYAGFAIDTDSPVISSFRGETALRGFLAKQTAISEFNQFASQTEYVSGAWIKGDDANLSLINHDFDTAESGKYFLWGYLSESLQPQASLRYDMQANWRCTGCSQSASIATGGLQLDLANSQAQFNLASPVLVLETVLDLTQKNQLHRQLGSSTQLTVDGKALTHDGLAVQGGIFGPDGQNAGLVFGFRDEDTHITGIATGQQP